VGSNDDDDDIEDILDDILRGDESDEDNDGEEGMM
jgi:hypothetical protein